MAAAITTDQKKAAFNAILVVTEAIREAHEIPSGALYALLMAKGCTFEAFERIIRMIVNTGLVRKSGDLLTWVGPEVRS